MIRLILFLFAVLAAGLLLIATASPADAQCFSRARVVVHRKAVVVKKVAVVETPIVFTKFVATIPLIELPTYSAVYAPPPPVQPAPAVGATAPASADLKAIADALKAIDSRLRKLEGGPAPVVGTPAPGPAPGAKTAQAPSAASALAVVTAKCAQCHEAKVAADKGAGLVLVENGALPRFSDKVARKIMSAAYKGTMPPKSSGIAALTDEEVGTVMAHLEK